VGNLLAAPTGKMRQGEDELIFRGSGQQTDIGNMETQQREIESN